MFLRYQVQMVFKICCSIVLLVRELRKLLIEIGLKEIFLFDKGDYTLKTDFSQGNI